MPDYRLACQTITFGPGQRDFLSRAFAAVTQAGYAGLEVGFRHVAHLDPVDLRGLLDAAGTRMVAAHIGGNLEDPAQAASERDLLDAVLAAAPVAGFGLVFYSGLRFQSEEQIARDLAMLNRGARRAADQGVTLAYHNHNWEFADDGRVYTRLLADAVPELKLCPDLGWLHRAGVDPAAFLAEHRDRVAAVHFKDYRMAGDQIRFVCLGDGAAELAAAAAWLKANPIDAEWMIAEQDSTDLTPEEAIGRNARFLAAALG